MKAALSDEGIRRGFFCREGNPIPWELVEQSIRASHPYDVFMLRSMLAVPYFEKAGPLAHFTFVI